MLSLLCPVPGCHGQDGRPRELEYAPICLPCAQRARSALDDLPRMYVELRSSDRVIPGASERVSGGDEPEPINLAHRVLATEIAAKLVEWEDAVRSLCQMLPRIGGAVREAWALQNAVTLIRGSGSPLWTHPIYAVDLATDLLRLKRRAWSALGWGTTRAHLSSVACPQCGLLSLVRHAGGAEFVLCLNCKARWDEDGYRRLVNVVLDERARRAAAQ